MSAPNGMTISHNGEVYNYIELRGSLEGDWAFRSATDTEVVVAAHAKWGDTATDRFRGMFAYAVWDDRSQKLVAVRDRFGIKPLYYAEIDGALYFASEIKAIAQFLPDVEINRKALAEYLTFQFALGDDTLFEGVKQVPPAHRLTVENGRVTVNRYWDVQYDLDLDHTAHYFEGRLKDLLSDSLRLHLRADVPIGAYLSGGVDSSLIAILSARHAKENGVFFHGRFAGMPAYDESHYAQHAAHAAKGALYTVDITADMFKDHMSSVIYHLDHPVAGPGSFPQYEVSALAAQHVKVVLGGQGGDEIFGGYARYLVAYLEQCIRAAIDGTYRNGNFVVTIESIIPRMGVLREYKPMLQMFWRDGLFGPLDERYFRLINRSADTVDEIDCSTLPMSEVFETFRAEFNRPNVGQEAYFDKMTHFDFKFLLPALLQVEDRMGMAHGLESRVPFLDHPLVEFAATVPANVKFANGEAKHLLRQSFQDALPASIANRRDKMGFPVPLKEWLDGEIRDYVRDVFASKSAQTRSHIKDSSALAALADTTASNRKFWGLFSLELWHQQFIDRAASRRFTPDRLAPSADALASH